ncbi:MAG: TauD/TfdA family dioxygenase, partial [Sphingobium sp.]
MSGFPTQYPPAQYPNAADPASPLSIRPLGGRIGARVDDVRLSADLDDVAVAAIRAALVRHKVLFFQGQSHLDNASHEA